MNWIELNWIEMNWIELNWIEYSSFPGSMAKVYMHFYASMCHWRIWVPLTHLTHCLRQICICYQFDALRTHASLIWRIYYGFMNSCFIVYVNSIYIYFVDHSTCMWPNITLLWISDQLIVINYCYVYTVTKQIKATYD